MGNNAGYTSFTRLLCSARSRLFIEAKIQQTYGRESVPAAIVSREEKCIFRAQATADREFLPSFTFYKILLPLQLQVLWLSTLR